MRRSGALSWVHNCLESVVQWLVSSAVQGRVLGAKTHKATRIQCQGIARSTKRQCRNRAQVGSIYCFCHKDYVPAGRAPTVLTSAARWCIVEVHQGFRQHFFPSLKKAIKKQWKGITSTKSRVNPNESLHEWQVLPCGINRKPSICLAKPPKASKYNLHCHSSTSHSKRQASTDTKQFRISNLPRQKAVAVWDYRCHKDAYTCLAQDQIGSHNTINLDHVMELHVARDAFDRVQPTGLGFLRKKEKLKMDLTGLLNDLHNLNFTTSEINQIKFRGVYNFQRDYYHHWNEKTATDLGLVHYLKSANYQSQRLSRSTTRRIQKEIVKSYDYVSGGLYDENPLHGQALDLLHGNMTAMRLF